MNKTNKLILEALKLVLRNMKFKDNYEVGKVDYWLEEIEKTLNPQKSDYQDIKDTIEEEE